MGRASGRFHPIAVERRYNWGVVHKFYYLGLCCHHGWRSSPGKLCVKDAEILKSDQAVTEQENTSGYLCAESSHDDISNLICPFLGLRVPGERELLRET